MKQNWKPGTVLYPLPAVLVSCGATPEEYNMLTVAWTGTVCTTPPMCYISVRPERHSYAVIRRTGEFVINLTTRSMARATDWCGVRSGRDFDKFRETGLTPVPAERVAAPLIAEAPVSIECRVRQVLPLGTHDMFLAEVVNVRTKPISTPPRGGSASNGPNRSSIPTASTSRWAMRWAVSGGRSAGNGGSRGGDAPEPRKRGDFYLDFPQYSLYL